MVPISRRQHQELELWINSSDLQANSEVCRMVSWDHPVDCQSTSINCEYEFRHENWRNICVIVCWQGPGQNSRKFWWTLSHLSVTSEKYENPVENELSSKIPNLLLWRVRRACYPWIQKRLPTLWAIEILKVISLVQVDQQTCMKMLAIHLRF